MARLSKTDLEQMGEAYFRSLPPELLVEVTKNLYELAVEQLLEAGGNDATIRIRLPNRG